MGSKKYNRAIIITNGHIPDTTLLAKRLAVDPGAGKDDIIICADGGAFNALKMGLVPDIVIGDMDSLEQSTKERLEKKSGGTRFIKASREKDESDTQLAIEYARDLAPKKIVITGALGGRMDHSFANIMLLALPGLKNINAVILTHDSEIFIIEESQTLNGEIGKLISLFSLSPYTYFYKTIGLKYGLENEKLFFSPARGLSNVFTAETARIDIKEGKLLIIKEI